MLECIQGRDSSYSKTIVEKKEAYCKKSGYGDGAMGQLYEVNYISFTRSKKLIVVEFAVVWRNCQHGYEGNQIEICEEEKLKKTSRINAFTDNLVSRITFRKK